MKVVIELIGNESKESLLATSNYLRELAGEAIPLSARMMALADVYDALTTKRIYKDAIPHAEAVEIIRAGRGSHFDPDVADAFLSVNERFAAIAMEFSEEG